MTKHVNLEAVLREPTTAEFVETPLTDVVEFFAHKHDVDIQLDNKGLGDVAIDPQAPVSRAIRKPIPLASALRLILDDMELAVVPANDVVLVTSKERADAMVSVRLYPVRDLLERDEESRLASESLLKVLTNCIAPNKWDGNGGIGEIGLLAGTLVVTQTRDVHEQLQQVLAQLRETLPKDAPAAADATTPKVRLYMLADFSPPAVAKAIEELVAPESWQSQGGPGAIIAMDRSPVAIGETGSTVPPGGALLVRQTADVHGKIQELVDDMNGGLPTMHGMSAGIGGGSKGGGGGFFRVPGTNRRASP